MSAVREYLFNIFAVPFHTGGRSSIRNLRTRHVVMTESITEIKLISVQTQLNSIYCMNCLFRLMSDYPQVHSWS
jgi:hypothetical protein